MPLQIFKTAWHEIRPSSPLIVKAVIDAWQGLQTAVELSSKALLLEMDDPAWPGPVRVGAPSVIQVATTAKWLTQHLPMFAQQVSPPTGVFHNLTLR
jgi:hypothetical protein